MNKFKDMPVGISLFLIFLFLLNIVYFCVISFSEGIFADYGYTLDNITAVAHILIVVFLGILIALGLYFVLLGFIRRDVWARKFTIVFIVWSALWPIWGLLVGNLVSAHVVILIIDALMIVYLLTEYVKQYFEESKIFRYGDWTLYVRIVVLKNDGRERPIYFFSKKTPKSGTPCAMPDGFEVGVSDRSSMPYLQKIGKPKPYKHGDWTLYKRKVRLNGGKVITIYFFSRGKPKSGVACPLPVGFVVGINKRSGMPFLRKQG